MEIALLIDFPDNPNRPPSVRQGNVSVSADLQHISLIVYRIPSERAKVLVPSPLEVEESIEDDRSMSWLSVVSFLDQGSRPNGHGVFEQTSYRLHILRDGKRAHFLLGMSLGSLSAIAIRNFWPAPWHLSAMEFQAVYDKIEGRYREYRLQTQSQWANASWEVSDTGESLLPTQLNNLSLPASIPDNTFSNYFLRRDGSLGFYQFRYHNPAFTYGRLKYAHSDILECLGLLKSDEFARPALVAVQHQASCQFFSPTILGVPQVNSNGFDKDAGRGMLDAGSQI